MKPAAFEYIRPGSIAEAAAALAAHQGDAKLIAGGQSLMPMMAFRMATPKVLIDIERIPELRQIAGDEAGVTLGSLVRWSEIERSAYLKTHQPLMVEAVGHIAHYQIRNRGTVGGSLAHADPAAEMPAVALVCNAKMRVTGCGGVRDIAADEFFVGPLQTSLADDEIITGVTFPAWPRERRWAFEEFSRRKGDFALAGVALFYDASTDHRVVAPRIVGFGIADTPVRLRKAEEAIAGEIVTAQCAHRAAAVAAEDIAVNSDIHAPADYRSALLQTLLERALRRAAGL